MCHIRLQLCQWSFALARAGREAFWCRAPHQGTYIIYEEIIIGHMVSSLVRDCLSRSESQRTSVRTTTQRNGRMIHWKFLLGLSWLAIV
ncbi:hypothetical protein F4861DRAFT_491665 [Xylaria intraflava]|nr:hypothetical protein F4861DRAFT_491665 [Xylaria intraflava]